MKHWIWGIWAAGLIVALSAESSDYYFQISKRSTRNHSETFAGSLSSAEPGSLYLHTLDDPNAVCGDGSPAKIYYREGSGSGTNKWAIHFQGGGFCTNEVGCAIREMQFPGSFSSSSYPPDVLLNTGLFSENELINPHYYNANQIFVPYCSADLWSGTREPFEVEGFESVFPNGLRFHGHYITKAVIHQLLEAPPNSEIGMMDAEEVLLWGSSAGGIGVFHNIDRLAEILAVTNADIYGLNDGGWIPEGSPSDGLQAFSQHGQTAQFPEGMTDVYNFWASITDDDCDLLLTEKGRCLLGDNIEPFISTPMFIAMSQRDPVIGGGFGVDFEDAEQASSFGKKIKNTVLASGFDGKFSPKNLVVHIFFPFDSIMWEWTTQSGVAGGQLFNNFISGQSPMIGIDGLPTVVVKKNFKAVQAAPMQIQSVD